MAVTRIALLVVLTSVAACSHVDQMVIDAKRVYEDARLALNSLDLPAASPPKQSSRSSQISPPRVFVMGNDPHLVGFVATAVKDKGFNVVAKYNHPGEISTRQVRYFHRVDRKAAARLAKEFDAELRDFTFYRPKPPQGNIEFWPESKQMSALSRTSS